MDDVKQQVVERLKQANNILVTVRANPSIDLLSACIGLALILDKLDKHAAAVFSGEVPSAIEFLKPAETIEQTPNSLRDFIIALDKSKADKLRYKVEDKVVRIFITPFKTSLSQDDLEFSQGDFNIDVVVALGVHEQAELDAAITAHGRILHDATVVTINNTLNGNLGSLNWQDTTSSSVSEMVARLATLLSEHALDDQISTALLTGIVAETARFSNDKTTPQTMRTAGELMASGANQQLVANELQQNQQTSLGAAPVRQDDNGTLEIGHTPDESHDSVEESEQPDAENSVEIGNGDGGYRLPVAANNVSEIVHNHGTLLPDTGGPDAFMGGAYAADEQSSTSNAYLIDRPRSDTLEESNTAIDTTVTSGNTEEAPQVEPTLPQQITNENKYFPSEAPNPFSNSPYTNAAPPAIQTEPVLNPTQDVGQVPERNRVMSDLTNTMGNTGVEPSSGLLASAQLDDQTLQDIEEKVHSPHLGTLGPTGESAAALASVDSARAAVQQALSGTPHALPRPDAFNAQILADQINSQPVIAQRQNDTFDQPQAVQLAPTAPNPIGVDAQGNLRHSNSSSYTHEPQAMESLNLPIPSPQPYAPSGQYSQPLTTPVAGPPPQSPPPLVPPPFFTPGQ